MARKTLISGKLTRLEPDGALIKEATGRYWRHNNNLSPRCYWRTHSFNWTSYMRSRRRGIEFTYDKIGFSRVHHCAYCRWKHCGLLQVKSWKPIEVFVKSGSTAKWYGERKANGRTGRVVPKYRDNETTKTRWSRGILRSAVEEKPAD